MRDVSVRSDGRWASFGPRYQPVLADTKFWRGPEGRLQVGSRTLQKREETVAFIVPRERLEAVLETMEIKGNPAAMRAIRRDQSGKGKYLPLSVPDEDKG